MKKYILFSFVALSVFTACGDEEEDTAQDRVQGQNISRGGAIETSLTTQHLNDTLDVLITSHKVWKNNQVIAETLHRDTIQALGDAVQKAADSSGNETQTVGKKDYEFYITVK
jgi:hypothetical protein